MCDVITRNKNKSVPDVHQEKPVRKHDRNLVEFPSNMMTQHVSHDSMET